ncbi:MAG TPA: hypothetical protein PL093_00275 [Candidatus Pacearchaeota archaeon]|nr:hypothetical protein [Candidatus Pacearchaeota archaeon]HRR94622.1 hypothetical protein [Candidatus Paceibacterota bacterium]HPC30328.1 hypothetical protein [Candidatus Pacearchaeota archaeon]HQG09018.1 hypothetical protein [Candidatus Pacearchaeota archaeon]HQH19999.1 hypothetical protein [Candidatus Pacearchaeota archaeon]
MKKRYKIIISFIVGILVISFIWFDLFFWSGNNKIFENSLRESAQNNEVIIIFNSGGFGTVKPDQAWDFKPLIEGLQFSIENLGYSVEVVPYYRTEDSWLGKAAYIKEILFNFPKESSYLAKTLENFSKQNPREIIILAGLSNGATFTESTMQKINCCTDKIFSIEFGLPFWSQRQNRSNTLYLTNNDRDAVSNGNILALSWSILKAPFVMSYTRIAGRPISFPEAMDVPGHQYYWSEVEPQISNFIREKIGQNSYINLFFFSYLA